MSDADRLRVDLHELGKRVLQAPCDRHGAAQGHIEIGHFSCGLGRCRIDRGAGFAHYNFDWFGSGQGGDHLRHQAVGLAARRPIANRDQFDTVLLDEPVKFCHRPCDIVAGLEWIDGCRLQKLAGSIDHRDFHAGPDAWIETHGWPRPSRRGKQQILKVASEDMDGLSLGTLAKITHEIECEMKR